MLDALRNLCEASGFIDLDDATDVLATVLDRTGTALNASFADIRSKEESRRGFELMPVCCYNPMRHQEPRPFEVVRKKARSLRGWVCVKESPVLVDDLASEKGRSIVNPRTGEKIPRALFAELPSSTRSVLSVPLCHEANLVGVLTFEFRRGGEVGTNAFESVLQMGRLVGSLIAKAKAHEDDRRGTAHHIRQFKDACSHVTKSDLINPPRTCFIARSYGSRFAPFHNSVVSYLCENGISAGTAQPRSGIMITSIMDQIRTSHFGIVNVTRYTTNVMIELGMIMALGKSFLLFQDKEDESEAPFDLQAYHIYRYRHERGQCFVTDVANPSKEIPVGEVLQDFITNLSAKDARFRHAKDASSSVSSKAAS